ncbi:MAG: alpha-amylase family glycosyl hydrolase [Candidatus Thermoplasmatota archaeon]|nr:alpha-amylase family glycosyl hydrolase [Candidatus Thermoplasmatota archaeon]
MGGVDWFKNAIIYHILIDRFYGFTSTTNWDKPIFLGGKIRGVTEKIPYLLDLGVNTIWISPFYQTNTYHGYHVTDFYQVGPRFGTIEDLKELIKTVHRNNMHIIADFVPNHCSKEHPFFKEAQQNKNSRYRDWFYFTKWPDEYLCFLSVKDLPKINLDNPDAREYMINVAKHWLRQGLDGCRLDHVIGASHNFWGCFRKEIKKENPNVVLIGEAWMQGVKIYELKTIKVRGKYLKWFFGASSDNLFKEYIGELDGVLDFKIQEMIRDYVANKKSYQTKRALYTKINHHLRKYPDGYFLPTFLDNHDMNRILFECKNNKEKLKEAAEIQFSINQPPIIYYGTEIGMSQDKSIWEFLSYGDLQARQPMNWEKQDRSLFSFYEGLIQERKRGMFGNFRTKTNSF